jgi:hypothetical protein
MATYPKDLGVYRVFDRAMPGSLPTKDETKRLLTPIRDAHLYSELVTLIEQLGPRQASIRVRLQVIANELADNLTRTSDARARHLRESAKRRDSGLRYERRNGRSYFIHRGIND